MNTKIITTKVTLNILYKCITIHVDITSIYIKKSIHKYVFSSKINGSSILEFCT